MSKMKSMDIAKVQADIAAKDPKNKKIRSLSESSNLTAQTDLDSINPKANRILIKLKSWPAQTVDGIIVPDSFTVVRGEKYIAEVHKVGPTVRDIEVGDVLIVSMFSGYHVTTKTGHAKIIFDTDVLLYKKGKDMTALNAYHPKTFTPGINYITIKMQGKQKAITQGGLEIEVGDDGAFSNNDAVTESATVIGVGSVDKYGEPFKDIKEGEKIILDKAAGLELSSPDVSSKDEYRVMFNFDVLATIG